MVRCDLSILLAERNLKITKVSKDTGVSRTTLTYLANNYSKGMQYDTLNTLCSYLHINPADLISFVPVDILMLSIERSGANKEQLEIQAEITNGGITRKCELCGNALLSYPDSGAIKLPCGVDIEISLWDSHNNPDIENENNFIISAFQAVPISFLTDIESDIISTIVNDIDCEFELSRFSGQVKPLNVSLNWDSQLSKR